MKLVKLTKQKEMKINFGGERLYSGNKMEVRMHDYYRSTHNLSKVVRTSMAPGTVVPIWSRIAINGDRFEIDLDTLVMTLPTIGPMFGTAEMDIAVFQWPIRLGVGVLHNNAVKIGMQMSQVKMPTISFWPLNKSDVNRGIIGENKTNPSSLCQYLGIRDLGQVTNKTQTTAGRDLCGLKFLAYWDFYKQYLANKQEDNAKMISSTNHKELFDRVEYSKSGTDISGASVQTLKLPVPMNIDNSDYLVNMTKTDSPTNKWKEGEYVNLLYKGGAIESTDENQIFVVLQKTDLSYHIFPLTAFIEPRVVETTKITSEQKATEQRGTNSPQTDWIFSHLSKGENKGKRENLLIKTGGVMNMTSATKIGMYCKIKFDTETYPDLIQYMNKNNEIGIAGLAVPTDSKLPYNVTGYDIIDFPLDNIDKAREKVLRNCGIGESVRITGVETGQPQDIDFEPYKTNAAYIETEPEGGIPRYIHNYTAPMNGLGIACYKSDLFNNWVRSEWIDGENSVGAVSAAQIVDGKLNMDTLNLSQHIYNQLTRVAVCDGTYEGWQEASYGEKALRRAESPIYLGGCKTDIYFEDVVSTANTETAMQGSTPLGTLAGKGASGKTRGGKIDVKVKEPSVLMAVAWITPHVDYSQGNNWEMTELKSMEDLHKPEFDSIGFQDLLTETMIGGSAIITENGDRIQMAVGKQPAFIQYQTDINECYGDFADPDKAMFMTFNRQYSMKADNERNILTPSDITTYINPTLFNQNFADSDLESQNFWVQIALKIKARRKMSAHIIPNL